MTSYRFVHKRRRARYSSEKSAQMNKARWDADRARRSEGAANRLREFQETEVNNLPTKQGDALGCLQWHDFRSGKVRRWTIRIGDRLDRMTIDLPDNKRTNSHGWTWILTTLRKHLSK